MQHSAEQKLESGRWSKEQHERFMLGLMQYGKNWKKVQEVVGTRSGSQVRSHAQKFFNKLQKSNQNIHTKSDKKKEEPGQNDQDVSFPQNDMIKSFNEQNSQVTPHQIISLIKKSSHDNRKINLSAFKKCLEDEQKQQKTEKNFLAEHGAKQNQTIPAALSSYKSMNNILSAYENLKEENAQNQNVYEDESFLIGLTKKYKKYFSKGGHFQSLIDFGSQKKEENLEAQSQQPAMRKKSWALAEGIEGDEQYLQDVKKKIKDPESQRKNQGVEDKNDPHSKEELVKNIEETKKAETANNKNQQTILKE